MPGLHRPCASRAPAGLDPTPGTAVGSRRTYDAPSAARALPEPGWCLEPGSWHRLRPVGEALVVGRRQTMPLVRCCEGRVPVAERRGEGTNCQRRLTRIASSPKPAMQEGEGVKLHLLIDTSVWLDLAKDYRQLPILDVL